MFDAVQQLRVVGVHASLAAYFDGSVSTVKLENIATDGLWQSLKPAIFHDSKSRKAFRDLLGVGFWRSDNFWQSLYHRIYFRDPRSRNKIVPIVLHPNPDKQLGSHGKLGVLLGDFNRCG